MRLSDGNYLFLHVEAGRPNCSLAPPKRSCALKPAADPCPGTGPDDGGGHAWWGMGWAILRGSEPTEILQRGSELLFPETDWEKRTGAANKWEWRGCMIGDASGLMPLDDAKEKDTFLLWYGGGDSLSGAAVVKVWRPQARKIESALPADSTRLKGEDEEIRKLSHFSSSTTAVWKTIGGSIKNAPASTKSCVHADGSALASCFGFNSTDATSILQNAFASGASLLNIDSVGQPPLPWVVTPLFLENVTDLIVVIEAGVTILAKEGAFHGGGDCLLLFRNCHNITLKSGISVAGEASTRGILRMRRADYADPTKYIKAEWRMAVRM
eukprot:SAG11_NODE_833_length_6943_cov_4.544126_2_plen_326_part_00